MILTPDGAFEARATDWQLVRHFIAADMAIAKGLPWSYSPQGILMRHAGDTQRTRIPTLEVEAEENEMKEIAADVASGLIGPTPGLRTLQHQGRQELDRRLRGPQHRVPRHLKSHKSE